MVEELRAAARLEAAEARVIARWDAERAWQLNGAQSGAAWLSGATACRAAVASARAHARAVRWLPEVAAAWAAGEIDRTHIARSRLRTPRTEEAFVAGHKDLLDAARTLRFSGFRRVCSHWSQPADPDGAEARPPPIGPAARCTSAELQGLWFGRMTLTCRARS